MSRQAREKRERNKARAAGMEVAPRPRRVPLHMARQCGSCSACCIVFQVSELDKLGGEPCRYLKPEPDSVGMCSIWDAPLQIADGTDAHDFAGRDPESGEVRKPKVCASFRCLWLSGDIPDELYPPASQCVFKPTGDGLKYSVFELVPDASRAPAVADFIATIADAGVPVIVIPAKASPGDPEPNRRLIPPPRGKNPLFDRDFDRLNAAGRFVGVPL